MIAKCECLSCGQNVEFEAAQFERSGETSHRILGQTIDCPNCGKPTQLYMVRNSFNGHVPVKKPEKFQIILAVALWVLLVLVWVFLLWKYPGLFSELIDGIADLLPTIIGIIIGVVFIWIFHAISKYNLWTSIFATVFFCCGIFMIASGVSAQMEETESAIRGTENVCQYGFGFLVTGMSFIMVSMQRRKK